MTATIQLPWLTPPLSSNRVRGNPYAQAARVKAALADARMAVKAAKVPWMAGAEITLHFRPKNRHRRDTDGLYPVLKVVQDALVQEGVLSDDSWVEVPAATCRIHEPSAEGPAFWVELCEPERVA